MPEVAKREEMVTVNSSSGPSVALDIKPSQNEVPEAGVCAVPSKKANTIRRHKILFPNNLMIRVFLDGPAKDTNVCNIRQFNSENVAFRTLPVINSEASKRLILNIPAFRYSKLKKLNTRDQ
jgi:hypothetical protein